MTTPLCECGCGKPVAKGRRKYAQAICERRAEYARKREAGLLYAAPSMQPEARSAYMAEYRKRQKVKANPPEIPRERRFLHCAHRCNGFCGHDAQLYRRQAERECFAVRVAQRVCPIGLSA